MKQITLEANVRSVLKKNAMNRMRTDQQLPAVLYGGGGDNVNLSLSGKEVGLALKNFGTNVMVKLNIGEGGEQRQETVMFKNLQRHPLTSALQHVDFIRVSMDQSIELVVPIHLTGTAPGIKEGGMLELVHRELEIRCLPALIPEFIEVDVSGLHIGEAVNVSSLPLVEGIEVLVAGHEPVVHVVAPRTEAEAPAEGAAAPAEAQQPEVIGEKEREERRSEKEKEKKA